MAAAGDPRAIANFGLSYEVRKRVAELVARDKVGGLSVEETSELDDHLQLEPIMGLAKARARHHPATS